MRHPPATLALPLLAAAAVALSGCSGIAAIGPPTVNSPGSALPTSTGAPAPGSVTTRVSPLADPRGIHPSLTPVPATQKPQAVKLIETVQTTPGQGTYSGYTRLKFGVAWTDDTTTTWGHDGCQTRDEILHRDMTNVTTEPNGCIVLTGTLAEPYTGSTMQFTNAQPLAVQIDHVMPLAYDWTEGASGWSQAKREQLANDPLNLLAVDGAANDEKSDSGPAAWLPPNKPVDCAYAVRFAQVSIKYRLPVTEVDQQAMLAACD
jgi:hypothetical protein